MFFRQLYIAKYVSVCLEKHVKDASLVEQVPYRLGTTPSFFQARPFIEKEHSK